MKYREIVDDIQLQFKSHNESVKTQNPYWILFRVVSEIGALRDAILEKAKSRDEVPTWMIQQSGTLTSVSTNSGGQAGVFDEFRFAEFTLPEGYYSTNRNDVTEIFPLMRQKRVMMENSASIIRRVRAEDPMLEHYYYAFQVNDKVYVYPFLSQCYANYLPKTFGGSFESINPQDVIPAPDLIISEARKQVLDSVLIQKQIPEDDKPDQRDEPSERIASKDRQ